jgi:hypothetical protein
MGETMATDPVDLFADEAPTLEPDEERPEVLRYMDAIDSLRASGLWQMMGGKAPEPSRNDPFKLIGEWVSLEEDLWTSDASRITWWAGHAHPAVRRLVASHEVCPPALLADLARDPWIEIRQAALDNNAVAPATVSNAAESETVDWLREALGEQDPVVTGRCGLCGRRVKRPDRFLTCSIRCSIDQANDRLKDGHYLRGGRSSSWPLEYIWSVARFKASGGIRGTGPKFWNVRLSFIPGLNAVECDRVVSAVCDLEDLGVEQAVEALDQMTRTLDGPDILDALGMGHKT